MEVQTTARAVHVMCNLCLADLDACECPMRRPAPEPEWSESFQLPPEVVEHELAVDAAAQVRGTDLVVASRQEQLGAYIAGRVADLPERLRHRELSLSAAARTIEIHKATLSRWSTGAIAFAWQKLPEHTLELLACLVSPPPGGPTRLPEAVRMRVNGGRRQLEFRGTHDAMSVIERWAEERGGRVSRTLVRVTVEGPADTLERMRADVLAMERWRTLTPTDADVAAWIGGAS